MKQSNREHLLASEAEWWKVGQALSIASDILSKTLGDRIPEAPKPVEDKLPQVAEMLYAFSVECHLKGILVATFIRSSTERQTEIEEIGKELFPEGEEPNPAHFIALLLVIFLWDQTPKGAEHAKQIADENARRIQAVRAHMSHHLVRLSDAVGIELDEDLRTYLGALSDFVQLGRYPAHSKKDAGNLSHFVGNKALRERLNQVLENKFEKAIDTMPPVDVQEVLRSFGMD